MKKNIGVVLIVFILLAAIGASLYYFVFKAKPQANMIQTFKTFVSEEHASKLEKELERVHAKYISLPDKSKETRYADGRKVLIRLDNISKDMNRYISSGSAKASDAKNIKKILDNLISKRDELSFDFNQFYAAITNNPSNSDAQYIVLFKKLASYITQYSELVINCSSYITDNFYEQNPTLKFILYDTFAKSAYESFVTLDKDDLIDGTFDGTLILLNGFVVNEYGQLTLKANITSLSADSIAYIKYYRDIADTNAFAKMLLTNMDNIVGEYSSTNTSVQNATLALSRILKK